MPTPDHSAATIILRSHAAFVEARCPDGLAIAKDMRELADVVAFLERTDIEVCTVRVDGVRTTMLHHCQGRFVGSGKTVIDAAREAMPGEVAYLAAKAKELTR